MADTSKIKPFDLERMLFGEAPPEFLIEVFFRGLTLYLFMLVIVKLLGKRMAGELTVSEMVLMITLGGSVAVAMQVPEGGALIGFVVLICALAFEKLFSKWTSINRKMEKLSLGEVSVLVRDGVLDKKKMQDTFITNEQVFAALRNEKVHQLGQVERLYLEAGGGFSLYQVDDDPPAGLSILPEEDYGIAQKDKATAIRVCYDCGNHHKDTKEEACSNCKGTKWVNAMQ